MDKYHCSQTDVTSLLNNHLYSDSLFSIADVNPENEIHIGTQV